MGGGDRIVVMVIAVVLIVVVVAMAMVIVVVAGRSGDDGNVGDINRGDGNCDHNGDSHDRKRGRGEL
jgi:hypothetical protein